MQVEKDADYDTVVMNMKDDKRKLEKIGHRFVLHHFVGRNNACPCGSKKKYKKCCYDLVHIVAGQRELIQIVNKLSKNLNSIEKVVQDETSKM